MANVLAEHKQYLSEVISSPLVPYPVDLPQLTPLFVTSRHSTDLQPRSVTSPVPVRDVTGPGP